MWISDTRRPDAGLVWQTLQGASSETGLVPVVLDALGAGAGTAAGAGAAVGGRRPWDTGELGPEVVDDLGAIEEGTLFRERWNMSVPVSLLPQEDRPPRPWRVGRPEAEAEGEAEVELEVEEDPEEREWFLATVAPWAVMFPGLALAESEVGDPAARAAALAEVGGWIGLVPGTRSADTPYRIGWMGATNHYLAGGLPQGASLSVMLRSWEDRFGARLLRLGFDTMELIVERPPSTMAQAEGVAAEHFAFAGDDGFQAYQSPGVSDVRSLAARILGSPTWRFWWD